jgi:hypothetical protein
VRRIPLGAFFYSFKDINSSKLYIIDLHKGPSSLKEIDTGMPLGVTVDIEGVDSSKVVLAGAKDGVTKFNLQTGQHEYVAKYWSGPQAEDKARRSDMAMSCWFPFC